MKTFAKSVIVAGLATGVLAGAVPTHAECGNDWKTVTVSARPYWVDTRIDVNIGETLEFRATGHWWDFFLRSTADGYEAAIFYSLRQYPRVLDGHRYYRLMGRIGDASGPPAEDTQLTPLGPNSTFVIGQHSIYKMLRDGRLYVFVNDRRRMYWNNWGQIRVSVKRVPQDNWRARAPMIPCT